jgi:hypothetical protein
MTLGTVRHLPSADRAIVEERLIREYLLNLAHADGGPKASFLLARGFAVGAWDVLQPLPGSPGPDEYGDQRHRYGMGNTPHRGVQLSDAG